MSAPRQVLPGATYLLTRRCLGRRFLLRPSDELNRIFLFCLAVAASRSGVRMHAFCVMSNHYHLVATDVRGRLPEFMHWLDEYIAKCINVLYGRWEPVWDPSPYSAVRLEEAEDVLAKIVYTCCNPVKAGLVRAGDRWPGLRSRPEDLDGTTFTGVRPRVFFRPDGQRVPKRATLRLEPPPALTGYSVGALVRLLRRLICNEEARIRRRFESEGRSCLGCRKVLAQSPFARPETDEQKRGIRPRIASRNRNRRIEGLQGLREFLHRYRAALNRFKSGERGVVFPAGTYAMRLRFGVTCSGHT